ncbi:hypothetical protein [Herpetosiphon geysericola]|uniref:hypothetical protein n=1 Tax=Herpetosiphon geysericola TaxID=70996 RepID=UPI00128F96B5|nr:hypothetical protein [Herpetosiphon geysericola]
MNHTRWIEANCFWWLCAKHQPIAQLIPVSGDFPWHYFQLQRLPAYTSYSSMFALEWALCQADPNRSQAPFQASIALKLLNYIRQHTYVLYGQPGDFTLWRGYYAHCDGQTIWFKRGTHQPLDNNPL